MSLLQRLPFDLQRELIFYLPYDKVITLSEQPTFKYVSDLINKDQTFIDMHPEFPHRDGKAKFYELSFDDIIEYVIENNYTIKLDEDCVFGVDFFMQIRSKLPTDDYVSLFCSDDIQLDEFCFVDDFKFLKSITKILFNVFSDKQIKRGDVVGLTFEQNYGDRNNGKAIYDGKYLVPLDDEYDHYGALPISFVTLRPFPVDYFRDVISNNCIHHFYRKDICPEMLTNLQLNYMPPDDSIYTAGDFEYTFFTVGNKRYYVSSLANGDTFSVNDFEIDKNFGIISMDLSVANDIETDLKDVGWENYLC